MSIFGFRVYPRRVCSHSSLLQHVYEAEQKDTSRSH